ncbi:hypothetical protein, partial [Xanthomonas campestris]|uniref:hypothetical protein n=1 Tax=Xanthomonas campestris TaxID=339 RepID=UPI001E63C9C8
MVTVYLARELEPRSITGNTAAPGAIATDFLGGAVRDRPDYTNAVVIAHHVGARSRATKLSRQRPIARKRAPTAADACGSAGTSDQAPQIRLFGGGVECVTVAAIRDGS